MSLLSELCRTYQALFEGIVERVGVQIGVQLNTEKTVMPVPIPISETLLLSFSEALKQEG